MRTTAILTLIVLVILCAALRGRAQEFVVSGDTVALLAKAVVAEADTNYRIPSAYIIPLGENGTCATITLSGVCEIFARTLSQWGTTGGPYPKRITGLAFTWHPPSQQHPELEPPADQHTRIPIMAQYTQYAAEGTVRLAEADPALTIPFSWTQQNKEKLTAAQLIVAMAALISKRLDRTLNDAYTIARIASPGNWEFIGNPYSLLPTTAPAPLMAPITLRGTLNGLPLQATKEPTEDTAVCPKPFCGTISLHLDVTGPVKRITILLDGQPLTTFDGTGSFGKSIDTLKYSDARHTFTITATPTADTGKPVTLTVPFHIYNGRGGDFTPVEGA